MKKYCEPSLEIIITPGYDVLTASAGVETPKTDENDGIWDLDIN